MKETDLLNVKIPNAHVEVKGSVGVVLNALVEFQLRKQEEDWYLHAVLRSDQGEIVQDELLESEDVLDILDDTLSVDQYLQDEAFKGHMQEVCERLTVEICNRDSELGGTIIGKTVTFDPYILQQHAASSSGGNLLKILADDMKGEMKAVKLPEHLQVRPPQNFIPDEVVLESLAQRIWESTPAIALLGPTGSGKSALARYVVSNLNRKGLAGYIIDANARLEGDRLFDRDDFNEKGTFILEGVLCRIARETKKLGCRLIIILDEYNSLTDDTRREFYRLFADEDRCYPIQSSKDGKLLDVVDFSHAQFILTGNPLSSENYLTDDLKRLSNAEIRRVVVLYLGYSENDEEIEAILRAIVTKKESFRRLKHLVPEIEKKGVCPTCSTKRLVFAFVQLGSYEIL